MDIVMVVGVVVVVIVGFLALSFAAINFDLASYLATGSETLSPSGQSIGRALVVYSPGLSGAGKESGGKVAAVLVSRGYTAVLAGIRSSAASLADEYDVVIVGGPIYFGKLSSSQAKYTGELKLKNGAKLGIFGTTGTDKFQEADYEAVSEQVSSLSGASDVPVKLILTGQIDTDISNLVASVLG